MLHVIAIGLGAAGYLSALLTAGLVIGLGVFSALPPSERRRMIRWVWIVGPIAIALEINKVQLDAVFLAGGDWAAAFDFELLGFILEGSAGQSLAVLIVGVVMGVMTGFPGVMPRWAAAFGVVLVAGSFGLTGHSWGSANLWLSGLVGLHILGLAFWVGVFPPLHHLCLTDRMAAARLAHRFGQIAVWVVPALAIAGLVTLHQLTGGVIAALTTRYGQLFALKIAIFAAVMGLAAYHRVSLTPALERGDARAAIKMRQSLRVEAGLILAILLVTSTLTHLTGPGSG
ncbi:MAG: CopD family protein [Gammaproteobacteria bacterium]|nr:CopD family protein [Gammaproteobacteria bacterium]